MAPAPSRCELLRHSPCRPPERAGYRWAVDLSVYVERPPARGHRRPAGASHEERSLPILRLQGFQHAYAGITPPRSGQLRPPRRSGHDGLCGTYERVGYELDAGERQLAGRPADGHAARSTAPGPDASCPAAGHGPRAARPSRPCEPRRPAAQSGQTGNRLQARQGRARVVGQLVVLERTRTGSARTPPGRSGRGRTG